MKKRPAAKSTSTGKPLVRKKARARKPTTLKETSGGTSEVDSYLAALKHPLKPEIEQVRAIILGANRKITERIKWNAPSFCYEGDDRVTMRLFPKGQLQLVFHCGVRPSRDNTDFEFKDTTGLLKWAAPDRATLSFTDMKDVKARKSALVKLVNQWIKAAN